MSNKGKKDGFVPKLRFPEFREAGEWEQIVLRKIAVIVNKRAGKNKYRLMSITAGVGLVSQLEKFGREIAGAQYKNYLVIEENDFAYNKSATKEYPEGFIGMYAGSEPGAVPNSIFTCFRADPTAVAPKYLDYLFSGNLHGRWLKKFITVGARAHGSLNIDDNDLLALPVPLPKGDDSLAEQQKIADCLASLDKLINLEARKLDTLKSHRKGLMLQLFPTEGDTVPKLRFPEFRDAGEWRDKIFEKIIKINSGKGFKSSEYSAAGVRLLQIENVGYSCVKWNGNTNYLPEAYLDQYPELILQDGDIVLALNRPVTNDELKIARIENNDAPSILYQRVGKLEIVDDCVRIDFAFHICRQFIKDFVIRKSIGSDQPFISLKDLYAQSILIPLSNEQQRIADCLTSLDDLVTAQTQKLAALKTYKKGLMQQLFPALGEEPA